MAKSKVIFECGACGAKYLSWRGKCDACGEWNSISESRESAPPAGITN
ncbi:MAG: DNA repair protein RadA, partial [Rickettsiales bacterium]|nr:DNA repair protein RadA [Rickettsiales bacterium]